MQLLSNINVQALPNVSFEIILTLFERMDNCEEISSVTSWYIFFIFIKNKYLKRTKTCEEFTTQHVLVALVHWRS